MLLKVVTVAVWAAVAGAGAVNSQTLDTIGGPRELPPSSFNGQMFVDSRGCVFLRAGYGGQVNWVPRVTRDRKVLCGYSPTMAALGKPVPIAEEPKVAAAPMPAPAPTVQPAANAAPGKPIDTIASLTTPPRIRAVPAQPQGQVRAPEIAAPPVATVPQAGTRTAAATVAGSGRKIGCPASFAVARRVATANGGSVVLCTRGDGSLEGARAPIYLTAPAEGRSGAGLYDTAGLAAARVVSGGQTIATAEHFVVPKGYKLAWTDDRLNPNRARGTAAGQAAQDRIWTREVPARLVAAQPAVGGMVVASKSQPVAGMQVSTKAEPTAQTTAPVASGGKFYVQIGTFGVPANAEGAKARLRGAGLPVGTARITKGGRSLQIVLAGPFADAGQAQSALSAARGAGFGDAFIR